MKKYIAILALFVLCQGILYAQETPQFGIGIDLQSFTPDTKQFFFPIVINPNFAMEPEIGYYTNTRVSDPKPSGSVKSTSKETDSYIGTGIFYRNYGESFGSYYGARLGFLSLETTFKAESSGTSEVKSTRNGNYIAPTMGAEYFFSKNFSIGGELQYFWVTTSGDLKVSLTGQSDSKTDLTINRSLLRTQAMLRWYF